MNSRIISGDNIVYKGHLTLVTRPHKGKKYDVVVSKDATMMLYVDEKDTVYLTKQFRPAIGEEVIALPAETLDKPGLSPLEVMLEGLEEECGMRISKDQVRYVGEVVANDGHDTERSYLFLAHGRGEFVGQRLEDSEKIQVIKKQFNEVYEMVLRNEIKGARTIQLVFYEKLRRLGAIK